MTHKLGRLHKAEVTFSASISIEGESYLIIYGSHINGNFCCIPSHNLGCEMSGATDTFYNAEQLRATGLSKEKASQLAKAIKEYGL